MAAISNHETAATPACKSRKKQKLKFFVEHRSKMVKFGGCSSPPHHKVRGLWVQRRWSPCPCVLMPLAVALLSRAVPLAVQRWDWWPPRSPASRLVAFTTEKKKGAVAFWGSPAAASPWPSFLRLALPGGAFLALLGVVLVTTGGHRFRRRCGSAGKTGTRNRKKKNNNHTTMCSRAAPPLPPLLRSVRLSI